MENDKSPNDVIIRLLEAVITGFLSALLTYVLGVALSWGNRWELAALAFAGVSWLAWMRSGVRESDNVETFSEGVGAARPQSVVIVPDGPNGYKRLELWNYVDRERFGELAGGVVNDGLSFTLGNFAGPNGLFSRGELEALRRYLISRGMLRERVIGSPNHGYELTRGGRSLFSFYAEVGPTPTLIKPDGHPDGHFPRLEADHTHPSTHGTR